MVPREFLTEHVEAVESDVRGGTADQGGLADQGDLAARGYLGDFEGRANAAEAAGNEVTIAESEAATVPAQHEGSLATDAALGGKTGRVRVLADAVRPCGGGFAPGRRAAVVMTRARLAVAE